MYNNNDIERFLIEARNQKERVLAEINKSISGMDKNILISIISTTDFVAEDFDRYDSDICEQFLILMEKLNIA